MIRAILAATISALIPASLQAADLTTLDRQATMPDEILEESNELEFFSARPLRDGIFYMPVGRYTNDRDNLILPNLAGIISHGFTLGTFTNSYNDQTYFLGHGLNVLSYGKFGIDLSYGIIHGYDGKLADNDYIPEFAEPLFDGPINPFIVISPYYKISDRWEIYTAISPAVGAFGFKYNFSD